MRNSRFEDNRIELFKKHPSILKESSVIAGWQGDNDIPINGGIADAVILGYFTNQSIKIKAIIKKNIDII